MRPAQKKCLAEELIKNYKVSVHKACKAIMLQRSLWYYKSQKIRDDSVLKHRIKEIANTRVRYGCQRIYILLRREGWRDNKKRVYRLYKEEGLNLRSKRPRRRSHRLAPVNELTMLALALERMAKKLSV